MLRSCGIQCHGLPLYPPVDRFWVSGAVPIAPVYSAYNAMEFVDSQWNVQFVSVTQEINTATSSGRMMLNILMTFSQYEREVISERTRDKLRASRRKGLYTGGIVVLGYRAEDKKLVVVPEEARLVRRIFQRYIEIQSPKV